MLHASTTSSPRTPGRLLGDLLLAARAAGVEADRRAIAFGIAPFADRFCSTPVEIRTTTVDASSREVSFRFVDESARGEVWRLARDWYAPEGAPRTFMDAVQETFELRGEGIDADVRTGFRKAWAFLAKGYRASRFAALPGAPEAIASVVETLERHGVHHISIVGTDHHNGTCNLYPMLAPGWATRERVESLAHDLGFAAIDPSWLEHVEHSVAANYTFSFSAPGTQRLAFYRPAPSLELVPNDPVLRGFAAECPSIAPQRVYIASFAYAKTPYRKVEVDYDGGIVPVLIRCAQVPAEPNES